MLRQLVQFVMPGLVAAIHVFKTLLHQERGWPALQLEDALRAFAGHDEKQLAVSHTS
jgi:hypothetical protein